MSDWTQTDLKQKAIAATEYRGYANVPVGEATYELPYRLLDQQEQLEVQAAIEMSSIAEVEGAIDVSEETETAEERVQELQSKDELTSAEEDELREAQATLARNRGELVDALGESTLMAFYDAGRTALCPDKEDVDHVMDNPTEARTRFADIDGAPTPTSGSYTRQNANEALRREMLSILDGSPFMVYFTLGQQVWDESSSAGKLVDDSEN